MKTSSAVFVAAFFAAVSAVNAQDYPNKPVRIRVGCAPGGGVDTTARIVAAALGESWGGTVIVENRPGLNKALGGAALRKRLEVQGVEVTPATPEQFREHVKNEIAKWTKVVRDARLEAQ